MTHDTPYFHKFFIKINFFSDSFSHSISEAITYKIDLEDSSDTYLASLNISVCERTTGIIECSSNVEILQQTLSKPNCTQSRGKRSIDSPQSFDRKQTRKTKRYCLETSFYATQPQELRLSFLHLQHTSFYMVCISTTSRLTYRDYFSIVAFTISLSVTF